MSVLGIEALIECDSCGARFRVEMEASYTPPAACSLWDVAQDAVRGGVASGAGMGAGCSLQGGQMLCELCTEERDATASGPACWR